MSTKVRLLEYLESKGVKKNAFYKSTGLSNGFLDKNDNINSDKIEIIISIYADINLYWLVLGEGEMLRTGASSTVDLSAMGRIDKMLDTIASQQRTIEALSKKTDVLPADNAKCVDAVG